MDDPLVPANSPLRRLPTSLDKRTLLYLDGIRFSFEIADLAQGRLATTLATLHEKHETLDVSSFIVAAVTDAWAFIDALHRLRKLICQTPRLKQKAPEVQLFMRKTAVVHELRNFVQHMNEEIGTCVARSTPLWGTISWGMRDTDGLSLVNCMVMPGTYFPDVQVHGLIVDTHRNCFAEGIVLLAANYRVDLLPLAIGLRDFASWFHKWVATTFLGEDKHGSDMFVKIHITPIRGDSTPLPEAAPPLADL